ncbi:glycoside hydrolase family 38 [Planctomycetota bacterium]|nr:glycoside hydrolase family 38 [Planctomycetota bacterium]
MKHRAHYVLSTHWDREWYQSFQHYRYRLVEMFDSVLDGLESGELVGPFQTDGQAIILEDYLEVRPEKRAQIEKFALEGKLVIGPWYVLPDEFLVSGESLVRNIRRGRDIARDYAGDTGVVGAAGFVCDLFGHISQMPQIMKKGFGVQGGMLWRGLNEMDVRMVNWTGADGTKLPCYRFGLDGYCSYAIHVREAHKHDSKLETESARERLMRFMATEVQRTQKLHSAARVGAGASADDEEEYGAPLLVFDGGDHQEWERTYYDLLKKEWMGKEVEVSCDDALGAGGGKCEPGVVEVVHSSLDDYVKELIAYVGDEGEAIDREVEGELREPGRHPIGKDSQWHIPGTLSSRVWIKQWNAQCETLLTRWAEPLGIFGEAVLDREYPAGFLDVAWKWLIRNHPHDSICGCSIDKVHEDMVFRFSQAEQIGERLTIEATNAITSFVEGDLEEGEVRVTVFNSLPRALDETVELELELPLDLEKYFCHFEIADEPIFRVFDAEGTEVPVQKLRMIKNRRKLDVKGPKFPEATEYNAMKVSMPVKVAGMGYSTYVLKKVSCLDHERPSMGLGAARHNWKSGMSTSERSMSNGLLEVTANSNGSLHIKDLRTGEAYDRVLTFEDGVDRGDGWYHGGCFADQIFSSVACPSMVAIVADGPNVGTMRIRTVMQLPEEYFKGEMNCRSEKFVEQIVDSYVTIRPGKARLEVETVIKNAAKDHRMRVLMPSGAMEAKTYLADSQFDVVERPIALREDNNLYREPELETKPMVTWAGVTDGKRGLAVVSEGQMECAVQDNDERVVALTLFRGTQSTVMTKGEPGGQLIGDLKFKYWIEVLDGEIDRESMFVLGQQLAAGGVNGVGSIRHSQLRQREVDYFRSRNEGQKPTLPACSGWLEVEGAVLSATEKVNGGLEIRVFNPHDDENIARLKVSRAWIKFSEAELVDFESNAIDGDVKIEGDEISFAVGSKGIATVRLT